MDVSRSLGLLAAAAWLGTTPASQVRADLLRCTGPDGRTVYTDDKSVCPAATPYQPEGVVHSVEPAAPAPPDATPVRRELRSPDRTSPEALRWRGLRRSKQEELERVASERSGLLGFVAWCNRGGSVFTRDEAGIKQSVRCNELNDRLAALDAREAELRDYLENGLAEDCRRAGCLPGWIR
jgi:hypothetical protein